MKTFNYGQVCEWDDIEPGDLFSFSDGEKVHFAIKIAYPGDKSSTAYADLNPPSQNSTGPQCVFGSAYTTNDLFKWDGSRVELAPDSPELRFPRDIQPQPGVLMLIGDAPHMIVTVEHSAPACFNIGTGEVLKQRPGSGWVAFGAWRILLHERDEWETLFQWPEASGEVG